MHRPWFSSQISLVSTDIDSFFVSTATVELPAQSHEEGLLIARGYGVGFEPLECRSVASAEALERLFFLHGGRFIKMQALDPIIPIDHFSESRVLGIDRINRSGYTVDAFRANGESISIPQEIVFGEIFNLNEHHRISNGWAYHSSRRLSTQSAVNEVIERDIAVIFWMGDLSKYSYYIKERYFSNGQMYQIILIPFRAPMHFQDGVVAISILIQNEPPFTALGLGCSTSEKMAEQKAVTELLHMRYYQLEIMISKGEGYDTSEALVGQTTYSREISEKTKNELGRLIDAEEKYNSDISYLNAETVFCAFDMIEEMGIGGWISKAWIADCLPIIPFGNEFDSDEISRRFPDAELLWANCHPLP